MVMIKPGDTILFRELRDDRRRRYEVVRVDAKFVVIEDRKGTQPFLRRHEIEAQICADESRKHRREGSSSLYGGRS